jgi:hypothetical protein
MGKTGEIAKEPDGAAPTELTVGANVARGATEVVCAEEGHNTEGYKLIRYGRANGGGQVRQRYQCTGPGGPRGSRHPGGFPAGQVHPDPGGRQQRFQ